MVFLPFFSISSFLFFCMLGPQLRPLFHIVFPLVRNTASLTESDFFLLLTVRKDILVLTRQAHERGPSALEPIKLLTVLVEPKKKAMRLAKPSSLIRMFSVTYHCVTPWVLRYFFPKYEWLVVPTYVLHHGAIFRHTLGHCKEPPRSRETLEDTSGYFFPLSLLKITQINFEAAQSTSNEILSNMIKATLINSKISFAWLLTGGKTQRLVTGLNSPAYKLNPQQVQLGFYIVTYHHVTSGKATKVTLLFPCNQVMTKFKCSDWSKTAESDDQKNQFLKVSKDMLKIPLWGKKHHTEKKEPDPCPQARAFLNLSSFFVFGYPSPLIVLHGFQLKIFVSKSHDEMNFYCCKKNPYCWHTSSYMNWAIALNLMCKCVIFDKLPIGSQVLARCPQHSKQTHKFKKKLICSLTTLIYSTEIYCLSTQQKFIEQWYKIHAMRILWVKIRRATCGQYPGE
ncbi:putative signal peptide protein [Puccinia sorghi]|uniref:Putative signal peptide protein n=1 Tax=Puccinia sorghi TaxID=27349 RepID=A0A0L6UGZ8_9BASI|nr:putative signal peptide protein [Puccinia sorghi]